MKALSLVYEKEIKGTENELNEEQITLAIESIKEGCKILHTDVAAIKSQFPFTIEKEIKDEEWVKNEIEKVNKDTATLKEYESELLTEYKTLIDLYE